MSNPVKFIPSADHDQHPDLRGRKQIAARLLIARNLRAHATLGQRRAPKPLKNALRVAETAASNSDQLDERELSLHDFVEGVLHEARRCCTTSKAPSVRMDECLDGFEEDISNLSCKKCVIRRLSPADGANPDIVKQAVCNGANDLTNLRFGGLCWQTFSDLFKICVEIAEEAYSGILSVEGDEALVVHLHTKVTTKESVGARTWFPAEDEPGHRAAIVELALPVDDFDDTYYLRLPYYIFHEVCVHSPESWAAQQKRQAANERCAFGEGFVDAAAVRILTRALEGGKILPPSQRPYVERFMSEAEKAQHLRADLGAGDRSSTKDRDKGAQDAVSARDQGMLLFKRLARREDRQAADEAIGIALCVNVLPLEPDERRSFMTGLDRASDDLAPVMPSRSKWLNSLRNAARRRNLMEVRALINPLLTVTEF